MAKKLSNIQYYMLLTIAFSIITCACFIRKQNHERFVNDLSRKKILLLYTSYRQNEEIKLSAEMINRTNFLKNADILFYCNNQDMFSKVDDLVNQFPNKNKKVVKSTKNAGGGRDGYIMGQMEGIADTFQHYKDYDYVIQLHPDVYITNENHIIDILRKHETSNSAFIVNKSIPDYKKPEYGIPKNDEWFSSDFFIFKPKLLPSNVFSLWDKYRDKNNGKVYIPEHLLYLFARDYKIPYVYVKRYDTDFSEPRRIDMLGVWHEHDLNKVRKYLNT